MYANAHTHPILPSPQASMQTGEDNVESEVQTEGVIIEDRWTQCPPEDLRGYGG